MPWLSQPSEKLDGPFDTASDPLISPPEYRDGLEEDGERLVAPRWPLRAFLVLQAGLLLLYTIISGGVIHFYTRSLTDCGSSLNWTPAGHVVNWETRPVDGLVEDSIFAQDPSPEVDDAWHNLIDSINLRILPDELERLGYDSLEFQDGSGYLGTMAVYHELHCLKRIRWWFYRDHYWPNMTAAEELDHYTHAGHCLELMRQATICRADTTMIPFKWLHSGVGPHGVEPTTQDGMHHQCAEWEPIEQWARERRVDLFDPNLLLWPE